MPAISYAAASFQLLRDATAAIDWFRNQGIDPESIIVRAQPPGVRARPPQRGDNARTDLTWIVALDLAAAKLPSAVARNTLLREGGKIIDWVPSNSQTTP
jgi:hypothetical protein